MPESATLPASKRRCTTGECAAPGFRGGVCRGVKSAVRTSAGMKVCDKVSSQIAGALDRNTAWQRVQPRQTSGKISLLPRIATKRKRSALPNSPTIIRKSVARSRLRIKVFMRNPPVNGTGFRRAQRNLCTSCAAGSPDSETDRAQGQTLRFAARDTGKRHHSGWNQRSVGRVIGGAEGDRTPDLIIANDTLSQLSYCPNDLAPVSYPSGGRCQVSPGPGVRPRRAGGQRR